jgi:hypothetical protein
MRDQLPLLTEHPLSKFTLTKAPEFPTLPFSNWKTNALELDAPRERSPLKPTRIAFGGASDPDQTVEEPKVTAFRSAVPDQDIITLVTFTSRVPCVL